MPDIRVLRSVDEIPSADWEELTQEADIDSSRGFLQFREYLEPGDSVLITMGPEGRLRGALRGVMAVPGSRADQRSVEVRRIAGRAAAGRG